MRTARKWGWGPWDTLSTREARAEKAEPWGHPEVLGARVRGWGGEHGTRAGGGN